MKANQGGTRSLVASLVVLAQAAAPPSLGATPPCDTGASLGPRTATGGGGGSQTAVTCRGVPFAAPSGGGDLRWRPPHVPKPWAPSACLPARRSATRSVRNLNIPTTRIRTCPIASEHCSDTASGFFDVGPPACRPSVVVVAINSRTSALLGAPPQSSRDHSSCSNAARPQCGSGALSIKTEMSHGEVAPPAGVEQAATCALPCCPDCDVQRQQVLLAPVCLPGLQCGP